MQNQINAIIKDKFSFKKVVLFAYSTNGIPGLELVGFGQLGRIVKEKFIYLTRLQSLKTPARRYLLCLDQSDYDLQLSQEDFHYLELPLFILFWNIAGHLPEIDLKDCYCSGKIQVSGKVCEMNYCDEQFKIFLELEKTKKKPIKILTNQSNEITDGIYHFSLKEIFEELPLIGFS